MNIDWTVEAKTEDGFTIFEADAVVEYTLTRSFGEDIIEVDAFEITPSRRVKDAPTKWEDRPTPARFSAQSKQAWEKLLFFHIQAELEADQNFIDAVEEANPTEFPHHDPNDEHRLGAVELL